MAHNREQLDPASDHDTAVVGGTPTDPLSPQINRDWRSSVAWASGLLAAALAIAFMYWAKIIIVPLVLAAFLTSILAPLVTWLERRGLGRVPAIVGIIACVVLLGAGAIAVVRWEATEFAHDLPGFSTNARAKIHALGQSTRFEKYFPRQKADTSPAVSPSTQPAPTADETAAQAPDEEPFMAALAVTAMPVLETLSQLALAVVLTIFMLADRENLRNRLIWLLAEGQLTVATKAVDEASSRISSFLLMQAIINVTYGVTLAAGLWLIGVKFALLWGFLAAVLRYIPFLGAWIAALFPVATAFAQFPVWWPVLAVLSLIVVLELVTNNVLEPWLYGRSMGVSAVGFIVAATFWTFLWGGIGLLLAGPLTVCMAVAAKHIARFRCLHVLLGDEQVLDRRTLFYQRLVARDEDEAATIAQEHLADHSLVELVEDLVVPSLVQARSDRERHLLESEDETALAEAARAVIEIVRPAEEAKEPKPDQSQAARPERSPLRMAVLPLKAGSDALPLEVLARDDWELTMLVRPTITSDLTTQLATRLPHILCLCALGPGGTTQLRYLCKRLRAKFPTLKIVVARFGGGTRAEAVELESAGADLVTFNVEELLRQLEAWQSVLTGPQALAV